MRKKISLFVIFFCLILINKNLFSEKIYFFARSTFANSQFWEKNIDIDNEDRTRKIFSNYFTGSVGLGMEMIIWNVGKKRGSRLFFKGGIDLAFAGINYAGGYLENLGDYTMHPYLNNGGAFYLGIDWDIYIGGSIPKTDLIWGFGCIFNFLFPTYSPNFNVQNFNEKYAFYAVPSILFGYDIFLMDSRLKLTPQMRVGFTCNSVIPDDIIIPSASWSETEMYSGFYIDFSLAFSFYNLKWKE